ncbi:MAG: hypothetical protein GXP15_02990 [Gammaproteobacteria bacterium]|nr:hypothetical protein [Gammaproteobacteria bacterium]
MFFTIAVVGLSLMLQSCTLAATTPMPLSPLATIDLRTDGALADAVQDSGNGACRSMPVTSECCCASAGIYDGSETSNRGPLPRNEDDQFTLLAATSAIGKARRRVIAPTLLGSAGSAETLPGGPSLSIRNCVYLI